MTTSEPPAGFSFADRDCSRSGLNFATSRGKLICHDNPSKKARITRDPMSHRIIEKRRRDRMNNSLADLSQVIPQHYLKQGHGRIEKTEIIEMAINHIKELKMQLARSSNDQKCIKESFWLGYKESMDEVMRYLVEIQNYNPSHKLCVDLLKHLNKQSAKFYPEKEGEQESTEQEVSVIVTNSTAESTVSCSGLDMSHTSQQMQEEHLPGADNSRRQSCDESVYSSSRSLYTNLETGGTWSVQQDFNEINETGEPPPQIFGVNSSDGDFLKTPESQCENRDEGSRHGSSVYKFKNDIKLRFTQDPVSNNASKTEQSDVETSSLMSLSYPADPNFLSIKKNKSAVPSPSSESTSSGYQTSEMSSISGSRSNGDSCVEKSYDSRRKRLHKTSRGHNNNKNASCVPGFALHPHCTYYIPIVINTEQLLPYLRQHDESSPSYLYHPISIPVNFAGGQFASVECKMGKTE